MAEIADSWGLRLPRIRNLAIHDIYGDAQLITGGGIRVLSASGRYVPFLSDTATLDRFPQVKVDMGAVRFVCNGADIMRPGVVSYGEFSRDSIVAVAEPGGKYLAVGVSLVDSSQMNSVERGCVVKSIHYISDRYWEAGKAIR